MDYLDSAPAPEDVADLLQLYDELVIELRRIDPRCQQSGWDTNDREHAAVERVRATLWDQAALDASVALDLAEEDP